MNSIIKTILAGVFVGLLIVVMLLQCKCAPELPKRSDYGDNVPCYLADVCVRMPGYAKSQGIPCETVFQKCFRYTDYDKCKKEPDRESQNDCFNKVGIRI